MVTCLTHGDGIGGWGAGHKWGVGGGGVGGAKCLGEGSEGVQNPYLEHSMFMSWLIESFGAFD